eukprot:CAMPEP_0174729932 /NCGR_PEP_ID=MMETSP1094-20130205/54600_1 /TAXON_ID=156173 /ORGANISM="Chrysochromulina brevifilum, Strain UTEX LB 985" /LENGTH=33 /DNA_ID= /DNA_START= /DNA_END= /DNA_ORIENTATION=
MPIGDSASRAAEVAWRVGDGDGDLYGEEDEDGE